jgi:hypothetical protein
MVASKRHSASHRCIFVPYQYDETPKHFFLQHSKCHHLVYCTVYQPVTDSKTGVGTVFLSHFYRPGGKVISPAPSVGSSSITRIPDPVVAVAAVCPSDKYVLTDG